MSNYLTISPSLERYIESHTRESDIARRLRQETAAMPRGGMQTMPDQVAFLALLIRLLDARQVIEIGTFTGYSALGMATALGEKGRLIACDTSREWTDIARKYWQEAGLDKRIDLRIAPAQQTLKSLIDAGHGGTFDLIFIDAEKTGYDAYYEASLLLLRKGGVIAFDNMLWSGKVADTAAQDDDTRVLRALNAKIYKDDRVDVSLLTVADGMVVACKR